MSDINDAPTKAEPVIAVEECVHAAEYRFQENLRLCFVGGSHAKGTARPTSDVDLFVVLDRPDRSAELAFAMDFADIHERHGLKLGHYGEVFDLVTLMELFGYTESFLGVFPEIQNVACYHGDCILSIFRKGDVVLKFFDEPVLCLRGDAELLQRLQLRARAYFAAHPMPRIQTEKGRLSVPIHSAPHKAWESFERLVSDSRTSVDTPVGVGLERWFSISTLHLYKPSKESRSSLFIEPTWRALCPLSMCDTLIESSGLGEGLRHQCLGVIQEKHS